MAWSTVDLSSFTYDGFPSLFSPPVKRMNCFVTTLCHVQICFPFHLLTSLLLKVNKTTISYILISQEKFDLDKNLCSRHVPCAARGWREK